MKTAVLAGLLATLACAAAQAVTVVSYDVRNTRASGWGTWTHDYSGSIVANAGGSFDYSGGSGSMNDGIVPTGIADNHLLELPDLPVITLHLDAPALLASIEIYGGAVGNAVPGSIGGLSVTINGITRAFAAAPFGALCNVSNLCNDRIVLSGSGLDLLPTDTVVLSLFIGGFNNHINVGEVVVNGASVVPEPASGLLLAGGLLALMARRKRECLTR